MTEAEGLLARQILVYNVSHIDMLVRLGKGDQLARPKFHVHSSVGEAILGSLGKLQKPKLLDCPLESTNEDTNHQDNPLMIPIGFDLTELTAKCSSVSDFHLRKTEGKTERVESDTAEITAVYFPLFAQIFKTWLDEMSIAGSSTTLKYVFLITGAGKARNRQLDPFCDSTKNTAECMRKFINQLDPGVILHIMDSGDGLFRYDRNVAFVQETITPRIEELRRPVVAEFGETWKERFHVTVALTQGSTARLAAINAAVRPYQPFYLHMWQLKTFWHEHRMLQSDLQFESFETFETRPCRPLSSLQGPLRALVEEMISYKKSFEASAQGVHELKSFWLRKTKKPVLSVLMVQPPDAKEPQFFRGLNVEVSMPTGSLCAERNVIGTALAANQKLQRKDLRMIAVLSMNLDTKKAKEPASPTKRLRVGSINSVNSLNGNHRGLNPISPCGACNEWLKKIAEVNPDFKVITFSDATCGFVYTSEIV